MDNLLFILICVILAILFGKMINVDIPVKPRILARIAGIIERGNFSYFYLHRRGPIILNLSSLIGDADLYISDIMYPTYEPESYTLHSATCGEDVIDIPESVSSPLAVGIYGHAESSVFLLEVYADPDFEHKQWVWINYEIDGWEPNKQGEKSTASKTSPDKKLHSHNQNSRKSKNKTRSTISSIFSVLEILQLIFL